MNKFKSLPNDIYSKLGIVFTNSTNRILANQYPYEVDTKTLYIKGAVKMDKLLKTNKNPTVYIIRDDFGEYIDTIFIPKIVKHGANKYFEVRNEENIDKRIPNSYLAL